MLEKVIDFMYLYTLHSIERTCEDCTLLSPGVRHIEDVIMNADVDITKAQIAILQKLMNEA